MSAALKKYSLGYSRLTNGYFSGFSITENGVVRTVPEDETHFLFFAQLDSTQSDCIWGRLVFSASLPDDMALIVHAFAANENKIIQNDKTIEIDEFLRDSNQPLSRKQQLFCVSGATRKAGFHDLLLYEQTGQYLWVAIELIGKGAAELKDFRIYLPGDTFFHTFPEVYRTNGEFLHRYLSIFSSLYNDLQETIDGLPGLLPINTAPAGLLPIFADWLGIQLDGNFLTESQTRRLLRAAFRLASQKGTRGAVDEVLHILMEEPFYIVERRAADGDNPFSFSVLLCRESDERLHAQLTFLLGQFKPARTTADIVFLGDYSAMDTHCYLDINAAAARTAPGRLDSRAALSGLIFLND